MIGCSIGIMAYNEEQNIGRLLEALLAQETRSAQIEMIAVVASGCTDRTEEIVRSFMSRSPLVRLISQPVREGKSSAVNLLLRNVSSEVVILESADTLPEPGTVEALVSQFSDPEVGMVGGRPIPVNRSDHFIGYTVNLLWDLHHQISLQTPKMGELIAFRNIFRQIPHDSAVDEASIEPLILGQGLKLSYAPEAVVRNKGPESVQDFIIQRRRIYAGHLYLKERIGYRVSTLNGLRIAHLLLAGVSRDRRFYTWGIAAVLLEAYVRALAYSDYAFLKRKHSTWKIAETTKDLAKVS